MEKRFKEDDFSYTCYKEAQQMKIRADKREYSL